jgi:hypothetical protein
MHARSSLNTPNCMHACKNKKRWPTLDLDKHPVAVTQVRRRVHRDAWIGVCINRGYRHRRAEQQHKQQLQQPNSSRHFPTRRKGFVEQQNGDAAPGT